MSAYQEKKKVQFICPLSETKKVESILKSVSLVQLQVFAVGANGGGR